MGEAALHYPGLETLIEAVDRAIRGAGDESTVDRLRKTLCRLIRASDLELPECFYEPLGDRYARREIYTSPDLGYSVIAMTWGPGQGTPVHDHCGMWCVEGVWFGELEVVQYELRERRDDLFRFESVGAMQAGRGSAGSLIPPHEYHTICNASSRNVAVSIHVYSGAMTHCNVFMAEGDGWYHRVPRNLTLD